MLQLRPQLDAMSEDLPFLEMSGNRGRQLGTLVRIVFLGTVRIQFVKVA